MIDEELDAILEASQRALEQSPHELLACARCFLVVDRRTLAKIERRLEEPVYLRGPRKGLPMDPLDVSRLESGAAWLRKRIPENLVREAWALRRLAPSLQ